MERFDCYYGHVTESSLYNEDKNSFSEDTEFYIVRSEVYDVYWCYP